MPPFLASLLANLGAGVVLERLRAAPPPPAAPPPLPDAASARAAERARRELAGRVPPAAPPFLPGGRLADRMAAREGRRPW